jgi:hypothetical protein
MNIIESSAGCLPSAAEFTGSKTSFPVLATYFIRQFFGDFRQKFRLATKAADLYQGG